MNLVKTDAPNLFRDPDTGAVLNTNITEYRKIVESRRLANENQMLANEVNVLKNELTEIKNLLAQLVNGKH